ncbi:MAG TPA: TPM domain-containing protein [Caulobacterales bacterium]|nr:TPM domain-containing protein [Caulobacterales bacterium]
MLLNSEDHRRIEMAVAAAEATTRGEIVCVVTDEAANYAEVPLAWAAAISLLAPILAVAVAGVAGRFDYAFGGWAVSHVAAIHAAVLTAVTSYALAQLVLFMGVFVLVSIPQIRRRLTPALLKRAQVRARALEQFYAQNLDKTRDRTGVLIFVSLFDRRAEVLADAGISDKLHPSAWADVIADLVAGIRAGKPGDGFTAAIERCGGYLAAHFPAGPDNPDELPNVLIEAPVRPSS